MIADMRYRLVYVVSGTLLLAGVVALGLYAAGADHYYDPSAISRWEHATRWGVGATAVVVVGFALAAVASLACLARGLFAAGLWQAVRVSPAVLAWFVGVVMAWYPLTGGH